MIHIAIFMDPSVLDTVLGPDVESQLGDIADTVEFFGVDIDAWPAIVRENDVCITGWGTPSIDPYFKGTERLRLLGHTGGSVRHTISRATIERGIRVTQGSAGMTEAVAEYSLGLGLSMLRRIPQSSTSATWPSDDRAREDLHRSRSLVNASPGIVGLSRIGRRLVAMLDGLGVGPCLAFDPYVGTDEANRLGVVKAGLPELMERSGIVFVTAPLTDETRGMIGKDELDRLKRGSVIVNTARGALIDEEALLDATSAGRISAALDVFHEEPLPSDHPFWTLPNVIVSPHRAGATPEARRMQGAVILDEVRRFAAGRPLEHEVTAANYGRLA